MDFTDDEPSCFEHTAVHGTSAPGVDQRARIADLLAQPGANLIALLRKRETMLTASQDASMDEASQSETQVKGPEHPGYLMPSPGSLHREYELALEEIEALRGPKPRRNEHGEAMKEAAFDAFLSALSTSCCAIVCDAHPHGSWNRNHPQPPVPQ